MQNSDNRKKITALPSGWPSKGMIRADFGEWIILAHPDRHPHISKDGKKWEEANLKNKEHNHVVAMFERKRWIG